MTNWSITPFEELSAEKLYNILALRAEVFVVEQQCAYQDPDGRDKNALHICGRQGDILVAYARILPPGIVYDEPSIGRVLSNPTMRRTGIGKALMKFAINTCLSRFPMFPIRISAQLYLQNFYEDLGFEKVSNTYLEDNIPHIEMLLKKS